MQPDSFTEIIFLFLAVAMTTSAVAGRMVLYVATMIFYMVHRMVCLMIDRMICFPVLGMHRMIMYYVVLLIAAIAYERLVMMTSVYYILIVVYLVSQPWIRIIDHHFVAVVEIITRIGRRQHSPSDPYTTFIIHKDMSGHVIVGVYIRQVVVVDIVVPYRTPYWLSADIDGYRYLSVDLVARHQAGYQQREDC